jgi:hypothetical protein
MGENPPMKLSKMAEREVGPGFSELFSSKMGAPHPNGFTSENIVTVAIADVEDPLRGCVEPPGDLFEGLGIRLEITDFLGREGHVPSVFQSD